MKAVFTGIGGAVDVVNVGAVLTSEGAFFEGAEIISAYTRKDALADGQQFDIRTWANPVSLGFKPTWRIFVTSAVKVAVIDSARKGWNIAYDSEREQVNRINAGLLLRDLMDNINRQRPAGDYMTVIHTAGDGTCLELISRAGPVDIDDPSPCFTLMTPEDN